MINLPAVLMMYELVVIHSFGKENAASVKQNVTE